MGFRDIVQHGYGVASFESDRTRRILELAFRHQYSSGMALRGWNPVDEKSYSDSALWLTFTLMAYLKESGRTDFLQERIPYFDRGEDSVLGHVEQALDFLESNKGNHGLCLIKFGDWNDSLTAIGKEGRGESVWLSMAYAEACRLLEELHLFLGNPEKAADYHGRYGDIRDAINRQAWDGAWYLRCFDDDGRPVGSDSNEEGKIFLNAQSWAMISGIATEERTHSLIQASDKLLGTRVGYMLLAPTFTRPDPHIGRISCLEPGVCENGTVYSHANAWMVLGLLRSGRADEAYACFRKITPGYMEGEADPKHRTPPYVYANGHFGPDHRNNAFQVEFTWITGSVAWHYNNILTEMIGFRPGYDGFTLDPVIPSSWDNFAAKRQFRGKQFQLHFSRQQNRELRIFLNGEELKGMYIKLKDCKSDNKIEIILQGPAGDLQS
jgi:cellobiose phosphorylase